MNRTEKKCVIASASFHLLLVFILMFGPAFLASKSDQPIEMELVKFDPDILTDAPGQHGGTPVPVPSAPRPVPPTPAPQQTAVTPPPEPLKPVTPPKAIQKEVQKEIEKTVEPENRRDPDGFEKPKNTKPKRQISTEIITRKTNSEADRIKQQKAAEAAEAAANRARLNDLAKNISDIGKSISPSTPINISPGVGGGGPSSANYRDYVASKYWEAWNPPARTARQNAIVKAKVTIARDGTVLAARITESSGDTAIDATVQQTLDRVRDFRPFPEGAKEEQRTYPLVFDLSAKRLEG